MIKIEKDDRSFYFCESADWSSVNVAESEADAARISLSEANDFYGEELQLGGTSLDKDVKKNRTNF